MELFLVCSCVFAIGMFLPFLFFSRELRTSSASFSPSKLAFFGLILKLRVVLAAATRHSSPVRLPDASGETAPWPPKADLLYSDVNLGELAEPFSSIEGDGLRSSMLSR